MTGTTAADGDRHVGSPSCTLATGTPAASCGTSATSPTGGRRGATPAGGVPSCAQDLQPSRGDAVPGILWVAGSIGSEARLDIQHHRPKAGAASRVAPWWAALVAVGGFTHGIGELRQSSAAPDGIVFDSWANGPIATNLGGEPAMILVPNLLVTGVLTMLVSVVIFTWAGRSARRGGRSSVLILLSIGLLLVGGGFGPPLIGVFAGAAAMVISASRGRRSRQFSGRFERVLAAMWPCVFWICLLDTAFLVLGSAGSVTLAGLFGVNAPNLFVCSLFLALATLPLVALTGVAHDARVSPRSI